MTAKMPFGKYAGIYIHHLPDDYLDWLGGLGTLREPLASAVQRELAARRDPATPDSVLARKVIDTGFRLLAKTAHPDAGGDLRQMQALNATVGWLRERLAVLA